MTVALSGLNRFCGKANSSANYTKRQDGLGRSSRILELIRDAFAKSEVEEKEVKPQRKREKQVTLRLRQQLSKEVVLYFSCQRGRGQFL